MTLQILVIGVLVSVGQVAASEPGLTAERVAECGVTVKRVTQKLIDGSGWDPRGTVLARELNTCRAALRANDVIRALATRRLRHHIEATRVDPGTAAARMITESFNRVGSSARFASSDLEMIDAFGVALAAEACLARDNAGKASVAARQALEMFNRLGADSDYPFTTRKAVDACLERENVKVSAAPAVAHSAESPHAAQASRQPAARKVTITGRLLYEDRRPIAGIHVMVMEAESRDDKILTTWKTGPDGKLANPDATTDKTGRFVIEADPSFWAGTGHFTLSGGFLPGTTTNAGILKGPEGMPMFLATDDRTTRVDLGDIIVKGR